MNRRLNNQKGISIIEVVVATAILGILVTAIMSLRTAVYKMTTTVVQRSSVSRVIFSIQEELFKDLDNLPFNPDTSFLQGAVLNQSQYLASFDGGNAQQACYDKEGRSIPFTTDANCAFKLSYYRMQELDRNYAAMPGVAGSSFHFVPMSRLVMRVSFTDAATKSARVLYLSRLKTHVLTY